MEGLKKNDFADLVPPPSDKSKILHPSTRFTRKATGMAKARMCAADKRQPYEDKTYAPVATDTSFKLFCVMTAKLGLNIRQWDINQAFLPVYLRQATGTVDPLHPNWVWKLKKSLYGLKEAALLWFEELSSCLLSEGFVKSPGDNCLFAKFGDGYIILINLHVDDFAIGHNNNNKYEKLKILIDSKYGLKDGPLLHFLHYDCFQDLVLKQIILTQQSVISEILDRANMQNCTPSKSIGTVPLEFSALPTPEEESEMAAVPYRELVGMLNQVATHTRPDIQPVVITLSRFLSNPRLGHWNALKQLLRYLKQTFNYGLILGSNSDAPLTGYSDASYNSCPVTCRSVGGYIIQYNDSTISWSSKWFKGIFPSSMETEYE
jgi:Reverse transcriptase (RNA-dependent DNA polymerase)